MDNNLLEIKKILSLLPRERLDFLLHSENPAALVASLPDEEVWLTIKDLDADEALSLLQLTSPEQLQYILDIETWKRDKWQPERELEWLEFISHCGSKKILEWVYKTDIEIVVLTLKEYLSVQKKEFPDDNPLEHEWPTELPPHTLDGVYYFAALNKDGDDIVRPIMELIAKDNHEFFMKLCETINSEINSNLEETAFSWRTKRLAEKGFVPIEEAVSVYKYLSQREIEHLPKRANRSNFEGGFKARYPLAISGESYPLFMVALAELKNDPIVDDLTCELAATANKVLVSDGRPIARETIADVLRKTMGYVNIGLEVLSGADPSKAANVLKERWLLNLFQVGYSEVARLKQHAKKFVMSGWPKELEGDFSLLDEPLFGRINALLRKRPLYFLNDLVNPDGDPFREFKSIDDIREVTRNIEQAEYIGRMFIDLFGIRPMQVASDAIGRENMKWSTVLLTIFAKGTLTGEYKFSPLTEREFTKFLKKVVGEKNTDDSSAKFVKWLISKQKGLSSAEEGYCRGFVRDCLSKFNDEFGELDEKSEIDWRFIQGIWVIPSAE